MLERAAATSAIVRARRFATALSGLFDFEKRAACETRLVLDHLDVRLIARRRSMHEYSAAILQSTDACTSGGNAGDAYQFRPSGRRARFSSRSFPFHQFFSLPCADDLLLRVAQPPPRRPSPFSH